VDEAFFEILNSISQYSIYAFWSKTLEFLPEELLPLLIRTLSPKNLIFLAKESKEFDVLAFDLLIRTDSAFNVSFFEIIEELNIDKSC
jgi:hypothetical protein